MLNDELQERREFCAKVSKLSGMMVTNAQLLHEVTVIPDGSCLTTE